MVDIVSGYLKKFRVFFMKVQQKCSDVQNGVCENTFHNFGFIFHNFVCSLYGGIIQNQMPKIYSYHWNALSHLVPTAHQQKLWAQFHEERLIPCIFSSYNSSYFLLGKTLVKLEGMDCKIFLCCFVLFFLNKIICIFTLVLWIHISFFFTTKHGLKSLITSTRYMPTTETMIPKNSVK